MSRRQKGRCAYLQSLWIVEPQDDQDQEVYRFPLVGKEFVHGDFVLKTWQHWCIRMGMPFAQIVEASWIASKLFVQGENLLARAATAAMKTRPRSTPKPLATRLENPEVTLSELLAEENAADFVLSRTPEFRAPLLNQLCWYPQSHTSHP